MRTSSDLGWDGPGNLGAAVRVAAAPVSRGQGTMVVMSDRIYSALDVTKVHTSMLDAFDSSGLGPLGVLDDGAVIFRRALPDDVTIIQPSSLGGPVDIVYAWAGADSRLLRASLPAPAPVLVPPMGRANLPPEILEGIDTFFSAATPL